MTIETIEIIRGGTFHADGVYRDAAGDPVNLTLAGITIEAFARDPDGLIEIEIPVTIDPDQVTNPGVFVLHTASTADWVSDRVGACSWNVRLWYISEQGRYPSEALNVILTP